MSIPFYITTSIPAELKNLLDQADNIYKEFIANLPCDLQDKIKKAKSIADKLYWMGVVDKLYCNNEYQNKRLIAIYWILGDLVPVCKLVNKYFDSHCMPDVYLEYLRYHRKNIELEIRGSILHSHHMNFQDILQCTNEESPSYILFERLNTQRRWYNTAWSTFSYLLLDYIDELEKKHKEAANQNLRSESTNDELSNESKHNSDDEPDDSGNEEPEPKRKPDDESEPKDLDDEPKPRRKPIRDSDDDESEPKDLDDEPKPRRKPIRDSDDDESEPKDLDDSDTEPDDSIQASIANLSTFVTNTRKEIKSLKLKNQQLQEQLTQAHDNRASVVKELETTKQRLESMNVTYQAMLKAINNFKEYM